LEEDQELEKYFSSLILKSHLHQGVSYFSQNKAGEQTKKKRNVNHDKRKKVEVLWQNYFFYYYL
jgi:hypothetical protein